MSGIGKYDPCPCGSGKQYKWCCLERDRRAVEQTTGSPGTLGEGHFIAEINPQVDDKVDELLARLEAGESAETIRERLELLRQKHPMLHTPHYGMGVFHLIAHDDPEAALPFFEQSVKIMPCFAEGHYNLAACAMQRADLKKAVQGYRAVLRYSKDSNLVRQTEKQLRFMESLAKEDGVGATLDDLIANQTLFEEAFAAMSNSDFQRAETGFRKVLEKNPRHVQSHGNLGLVYAGIGMKAAALACLEQALALDPEYEPAIKNRRTVALMTEGIPLVCPVEETDFYEEKLAQHVAKSNANRSN